MRILKLTALAGLLFGVSALGAITVLNGALGESALKQKLDHRLEAQGTMVCTQEYAPVCARIGNGHATYSNQCFASAAGAEVIAQGPCPANSWSPRRK
jgi:hypothetical protein